MHYHTILIDRQKDDLNGRRLCGEISMELTYLSDNGLDGFMLTPLLRDGTTVGVIIAARGDSPGAAEERKAFIELTGYNSPQEMMGDVAKQETDNSGTSG